MKKILLSLLVLSLAFVIGCKKEEESSPTGGGDGGATVAEVNTSIVVKHTGSKCPPCGGWGWTAYEDIISTNKGNAAFISAYSQNFVAKLFITQTANKMDDEFGERGYPTFSANGKAQLERTNGVNVNAEKGKVKDVVDAHKSADVIVNTNISTSFDGDKLMIDTKTKFFKEVQGQYNIAVYVLEDKAMGEQSGHPSGSNTPVAHKHVLRGSAIPAGSTSVDLLAGTQITNGTTAVGASFDKKFTFDVAGYDKSNIEVVTVIWKKDLGSLDFVNASTDQK